MNSDLYVSTYNPDVISCLANLSNDEVFTPPNIVNDMLDMLPKKLWSDKKAKFLDPACKSGVFLREIAKRLLEGLKDEIPDLQQRINHIFHNQIYGIAITELTSLLSRRTVYCSKYPNSKYSITSFDNVSGNIRFMRIPHKWARGKCEFCGASKSEYDRGEGLETHAYEFIHTDKPEEILNMKFDVIIGNPPYQLGDGGHGMSAKPIYQHFVEQAKKLNPKYLSLIIPARWYAGGKGLDDFRETMLNDSRIHKLVDFENSADVFSGVDIAGGICYFLWERDYKGLCEVTNYYSGAPFKSKRYLNEFPTFIRHSKAVGIVRKVQKSHGLKGKYLSNRVSSRKPFGLPTNYQPKHNGIPCWFIQRIGLQYATPIDINDQWGLLNRWKLLVPKAPIAGQTDFTKPVGFYYDGNTRIAKPGECCTESWIVAGAFDSEEEVLSYKSYLFTKVARFLLLQTVVSQDVTRKKFCFVPDLGTYKGEYTDEMLCRTWGITEDEWEFIDTKISNIGGNDDE
jgi:site-specific DNA-methyltransferase (adenine-specific)